MFLISLFFGAIGRLLRRRQTLLLENLALRQQIPVLKKQPQPRADKMRSLLLDRSQSILVGVEEFPAGGEARNRRGLASSSVSHLLATEIQSSPGRKKADLAELQPTIFRVARENPTWGAPRIHGKLLTLWLRPLRTNYLALDGPLSWADRTRRWLPFLGNHREVMAAMDFFTLPTIMFQLLSGFFVIDHDCRRILRFNPTAHPTTLWITQLLQEAFSFEAVARYLIFDRDAKYGLAVPATVRDMGWDGIVAQVTGAVRGRRVCLKAGWEAVAANCSIMSSPSTSATCADFLPGMSTTSTRTAPIWNSAKEPRTKGLARSVLERSSHARSVQKLDLPENTGSQDSRQRTDGAKH